MDSFGDVLKEDTPSQHIQRKAEYVCDDYLKNARDKLQEVIDTRAADFSERQADLELKHDNIIKERNVVEDQQRAIKREKRSVSHHQNRIIDLKKNEMLSKLLTKQRLHIETARHLETARMKRISLLQKLELVHCEKNIRSSNRSDSTRPRTEQFLDEGDGNLNNGDQRESISQHNDYTVHNIRREAQQSLRSSLARTMDTISEGTSSITRSRFQAECDLRGARDLRPDGQHSHVTIDELQLSAQNLEMNLSSKTKLLDKTSSMLEDELEWMDSSPATPFWEFKESVKASMVISHSAAKDTVESRDYLELLRLNDEMMSVERDNLVLEIIALHLSKTIAIDQCDKIIREISKEVINERKKSMNRVSGLISESSSCVTPEYNGYLKSSGRLHLAKGCLLSLVNSHSKNCKQHEFCSRRTQYSVNAFSSIPKKYYSESAIDKTLSLRQALMHTDDEVKRGPLIGFEKSYWRNVRFALCCDQHVHLPAEIRDLCIIRIFARPSQYLSLLVVGSRCGRMAVWSVPWNSNVPNTPTLLSISPRLPMREECCLVDVRECASAVNQLLTLDEKGAVRVWCLNPVSRRKDHTRNMFPSICKRFAPIVPSCLFYMAPSEYNMPKPSVFGLHYKMSSIDYKSIVSPQHGTFPQRAIFFPSSTFTSRFKYTDNTRRYNIFS